MTYRRFDIRLPSPAPGVQLTLLAHQFGNRGNGRSAYLHAGLHADQHPGLLVLQHLLEKLQQLDAAGAIDGLVTVVPYANPIGMSQRLFGAVVGRFDFENGENFNRNFPLLDQQVAAHLAEAMAKPVWRHAAPVHGDQSVASAEAVTRETVDPT
ncbi:putative deacylase [Paraburkholderia youngii]|uniref:hypothetical protein n=1 Tax=Paraburkholderia youngii TaxID=2782701 RepID=UPI003D23C265